MPKYYSKLSALGLGSSVTELSLANGKREREAIIILLLAKIFVLQKHQCTAQLLVRSINYQLQAIATVTTSQRYSITISTP